MNRHIDALTNRPIVALDGEGVTEEDGNHRYVLMVSSDGSYIANPEGLSTQECLKFVYQKGMSKLCVGYGFSYDVNMILSDCSEKQIRLINAGCSVVIGDYVVTYVSRKSLKIERKGLEGQTTVWDLLPFCQCSFLKALKSYQIEHDEDLIATGKANRSTFTQEQLETDILPYTVAEVIALKELATKIRDYLKEANLSIRRYDGAGAVAAALLEREGIKKHLWPSEPEIEQGAKHAYSGGRIEAVRYGHTNRRVYHYDINSAYPYAATKMPSLTHGEWKRGEISDFALYLVKWSLDEAEIYPFPYRRQNGAILYPREGVNWVWTPEVLAAKLCDVKGDIQILDSYAFLPSENIRPFSFIEQLYETRREWKQQGIGAEKMLKLGINSVYGKLAQQVGYNVKTGRKPPFHQLEYAGYITSYVRAMMFRAAYGKQVIAFATDGVYSLEPLDLPCSANMGEWEYHEHDSMTLVQSGVYWLNRGEEEETFYRGFDANSLQREEVLQAWSNGLQHLEVPSTRFVGMTYALHSNPPLADWRRWVTTPRMLQLTMRNFSSKRVDLTEEDLSQNMVLTIAGPNFGSEVMSTPHSVLWDIRKDNLSDIVADEVEDTAV